MHHTLLSLVTLPTLALLVTVRSLSRTTVVLGRWSEELLRGDRLPLHPSETQLPEDNPDSPPERAGAID